MMDVSIIIVNYNTQQMTSECIDSIFFNTHNIVFEVILVDNASTDNSCIHFSKDQRIKYIYNKKNVGFGNANNIGIQNATGRYILFLNSDTLLINNAIYEFVKYMDAADDKIGFCGCLLTDINGKPIHSFGAFPSTLYFFHRILQCYIGKLCPPMNRPHSWHRYPKMVDYITGADLFVRKGLLTECGAFDPQFFMYYEETEMQMRFVKAGWQGVIIDTPQIAHLQGMSSKQKKSSLRGMIMELRGRYIYLEKTHSYFKKKLVCYMHLLMIPYILQKRVNRQEKRDLIDLIIKNL